MRDAEIRFEHLPDPGRQHASLHRNLSILQHEVQAGRATGREYFYLARTLLGLGRLPEAVAAWCTVLRRQDLGVESRRFAHLYLGRVYHQLGDATAAAAHARLLLARAPRFAEAACLLGDIAAEQGDIPQALHWYRRAMRSGPCPAPHLFHKPACYGEYPRKRLDALARATPTPPDTATAAASGDCL
jgi:tetratricopeptide (TPR) repeat protein